VVIVASIASVLRVRLEKGICRGRGRSCSHGMLVFEV
jgi:hypothetical protein